MSGSRWQAWLFTMAMTVVSRGLMARDSLLGVTRRLRRPGAGEAFFFSSKGRRLAGVFVREAGDGPVLLICHGIGETVEHWGAVQVCLGERGIGSMVFDYSGYGKSSGWIAAQHCDQDLVAAYGELRRRVGAEAAVFVLGFSLGSGIAGSGADLLRPRAAGLFLCEAFTTFREAAVAAGLPKRLTRLVPDIWKTVEATRDVPMPVCVVHSDGDRLFPMEMARRIAEACGTSGELVAVRGLRHNALYLEPGDVYWGGIVERMLNAGYGHPR